MTVRQSAIRATARGRARDHLRAAIVTAVVPTAAAVLLLWLVPAGCDERGDPAVYRWTCLLPGLLTMVPVGVAVVLPIALALNARLARPLPDGWLVTVLGVGLVVQVVLATAYALVLGPAYRALFLAEIIFIPQPFVAGAIAGAVYWAVLHMGPFRQRHRTQRS